MSSTWYGICYCGSALYFWYEWVDTMLHEWMQCWICQWKLARFIERTCKHCDSVPGNSQFRFGLSTFTQDAIYQMALFGSAAWWRYVMWNARSGCIIIILSCMYCWMIHYDVSQYLPKFDWVHRVELVHSPKRSLANQRCVLLLLHVKRAGLVREVPKNCGIYCTQ